MTNSQKITIAISKTRERLNEIAGIEPAELTDELRSERDGLVENYGEQERQLRAALVAEDAETKAALETRAGGGDDADGEERELRSLIDRSTLSGCLVSIANGTQFVGAERELAEHRGLNAVDGFVPWDVLVPETAELPTAELRADVVTPAPATGTATHQATIMQRVFARSSLARLQVSMPSVPIGTQSYPVMGTGQTPAFVARGSAKDAVAGTITPNTVKPKRLQARFQFEMESAVEVVGLEAALRDDLTRAVAARLDAQIVGAGDAQVRGFLATAANGGLADRAGPDDIVTFETAAEEAAAGVDGIYAGSEMETGWIIGVATYRKLASLIAGNTAVSATERIARILRFFGASAHVPAVAATRQQGIMAKLGAGGGNAVAPIWQGLQFERDPLSNATEGKIQVTATMFANFRILRKDAFLRTGLQVTA